MRRWILLSLAGIFACGELPGAAEELDNLATYGDAGPNQPANLANCEPGLHPVAQRVEIFEDDGTSSCAFAELGSYVCIKGFCGDGRCEAAEAVPCGCTLDCRL